ncbi:peptide ABC transporter substrate-binding protein [Roseovarius sp. SCSIO 43702]|nr:peptide ABC transporter substrate-binding protein [Roseovarius sp. SCSIO 43702]
MVAGLVWALALAAPAGAQVAPDPSVESRGRDGTVRVLFWQAPSTLNPYLTGGTKDIEAASSVLEPLARYDENGRLVPWLARVVPSRTNGGISADLTRITWSLKQGVTWSDGTPLTARDVVFTWRYCTAEGAGCAQRDAFADVAKVEALDDHTVEITFDAPKPFPYAPFVGAQTPILQAAQFADCLGPAAAGCTEANFAPIGTGPFTVAEFRTGDVARLTANPNYRTPGKPAFAEVILKGGGSAVEAARSVLETQEFDYAWNLQLSPEILAAMLARGHGEAVVAFGTLVERIAVNFTDPDPALGPLRATRAHPHPILTDPAVRDALSLAIDRAALVAVGYGETGRVTCNIIPAPEFYASDTNAACRTQDLDAARATLDAAGWIDSDGDGVREKEGRELRLLLQTSTNAVRQDFQAILKQWWAQIGIATELRNIEPSVFFGGDAGSPDTFQKFFADLQMFAGNYAGTDPEAYLEGWTCDAAPTPANGWQGANVSRWCDPGYDALAAELSQTAGLEARAALVRRMNDMLVMNRVVIPLVDRGRVSAHARDLGGVVMNAWDGELWNIADWHRLPPE